jgi:hypothetical protein
MTGNLVRESGLKVRAYDYVDDYVGRSRGP